MSGMDGDAGSNPTRKRSGWKFSKGRFSALLSGNLIVWVIFFVSVFGIDVFSMGKIPIQIPQKLGVSGIVYNETSPSAIISNQVYGIGDVVDGYTISRITRTEVEFQKGDKIILRQVR
ncbi:MAG: hypothetical protein ACYSTR_02370 [Planctomycetota bacterium]